MERRTTGTRVDSLKTKYVVLSPVTEQRCGKAQSSSGCHRTSWELAKCEDVNRKKGDNFAVAYESRRDRTNEERALWRHPAMPRGGTWQVDWSMYCRDDGRRQRLHEQMQLDISGPGCSSGVKSTTRGGGGSVKSFGVCIREFLCVCIHLYTCIHERVCIYIERDGCCSVGAPISHHDLFQCVSTAVWAFCLDAGFGMER